MKLAIMVVDPTGAPITGAAASTSCTVRRNADGWYFDFDDLMFKPSGWTTPSASFSEVSAAMMPGRYEKDIVVTPYADGGYAAAAYFDNGTHKRAWNVAFEIRDGAALTPSSPETAVAVALTPGDVGMIVTGVWDAPDRTVTGTPVDAAMDSVYQAVFNATYGLAALRTQLDLIKGGAWTDESLASLDALVDQLILDVASVQATASAVEADLPTLHSEHGDIRGDVAGAQGALSVEHAAIVSDVAAVQVSLDTLDPGTVSAEVTAIKAQTDRIKFDADDDVEVNIDTEDAERLLGYGIGDTPVDHDTGGVDALRYTTELGDPIADATIRAFTKADYDAGNRSAAYVVATSETGADGRWDHPIYLNTGTAYTIVFYKSGFFGPDATEVTP